MYRTARCHWRAFACIPSPRSPILTSRRQTLSSRLHSNATSPLASRRLREEIPGSRLTESNLTSPPASLCHRQKCPHHPLAPLVGLNLHPRCHRKQWSQCLRAWQTSVVNSTTPISRRRTHLYQALQHHKVFALPLHHRHLWLPVVIRTADLAASIVGTAAHH